MKLRLFVAGVGIVTCSIQTVASAEEALQLAAYSPEMADEIVVTASRSPMAVKDALASTTVITREQLEASQARDLYQVLRSLAGVQINRNGGRGSATSVSLRGLNSSGTLVLVDGINIESATLGQASLEQLSLDQIERIEVLRGPKSSLYGSSAMGGVVQIFTRNGSKQQGVTYSVGGGSNNTVDAAVSASGKTESSRFNISASHVVSDGIDVQSQDDAVAGAAAKDEDGFHRSALSLNLEQDFTDTLSATAILSKNLGESEIDSYSASDAGDHPYSEYDTTLYSLALNYDTDSYSSKLKYGKLIDSSETWSDNVDPAADYDLIETQRQQGTWENTFRMNRHLSWNFGMDYTHEEVVSTNAYTQTRRDNFAGYLNMQSHTGIVSTALGVRHDDNEQFGSYLTGDAGLGVDVTDNTVVSLNLGTAFKAPSFNDLYWPQSAFSGGNPGLQPEEVKSAELGVETYQDNYMGSFRVYRSEVDNMIDWAPTASGKWIPQNVSAVDIEGAEVQAGTEWMDMNLSATFTYETVKNSETDAELIRKPRRKLSVSADKQMGAYGIGMTLYAQSQHYEDVYNPAIFDTERKVVGGYGDVALRASWAATDELKLRARVDNLFDNDYVEIYGYNIEGRVAMLYLDYTPK